MRDVSETNRYMLWKHLGSVIRPAFLVVLRRDFVFENRSLLIGEE
ncbi:MAG: hypothetical protein VYA59_09070 [Pseudomonadota bacterium]|nr:hypothetical protein [Pseudomonadota bacterium]